MSKMDNTLPTEFDLIVVGTGKISKLLFFGNLLTIKYYLLGMIESIIAAAASRVGKKVLHIDRYVKVTLFIFFPSTRLFGL